jgi:protein-disulfide isomerase
MKSTYLTLAVAALLPLTACKKDAAGNAKAVDSSQDLYKAVPAPVDGDWTKLVVATPAGGFMMGNPGAKLHLIEYGALSCPHCKHFDESGTGPLIDNYVKTGKVSYEFRNYLLNALDLGPSLIARCNGAASFFPLTRALYKDQEVWIGKIQAAPQAQLDALQNIPQAQVPAAAAKLAGLPEWAAMRGVPEEKSAQCLSDSKAIDKLVQMTSDATAQYPDFPGTPTFILNGKMVEMTGVREDQVWPTLEKKLKEGL